LAGNLVTIQTNVPTAKTALDAILTELRLVVSSNDRGGMVMVASVGFLPDLLTRAAELQKLAGEIKRTIPDKAGFIQL